MQHMHSCPKYPSLHVLFREQLQVIMQFVSKYELPMLQGHVGVITPLTTVKRHIPLGLGCQTALTKATVLRGLPNHIWSRQ